MSDHSHHHHHVHHAPAADALGAYTMAHDAAQPAPGGRVVMVALEASEFDWEFVAGRPARAWGYDGQVPGPVLEANVGDVLEVRLTNRLAEPTTIHWHGLRLPAPMDGTDMVQHPVAPGETFTYRFMLPDAGTFWYHSHTNERVQMERGLYGALVVRGPGEPRVDAERVLVLDDVALDRKGQIKPPGWWIEQHDGRQGSTRLVNGLQEPVLAMAAGQIERWRIVNAASARYVRLSLGGRPFALIGSDGGLLAAPVTMTEVLLAPSDRVELAVGPFAEGETLRIESLAYDRKSTNSQRKAEPFATVRVGAAKPSVAEIPSKLRDIEPLVTGSITPNREVHLGARMSFRHGVDFLVNQEQHHRDQPVRVGELQVWDIVNDTLMDHPFHLHGFFFQVVSVNGEPPTFLSWEDTVNVPPKSTVRIAWVPDDRPGEWMYHCHIVEHHANGMMGHFAVVP
ncbi:multicopper oxidase type 3 [Gemmatirosa kalamazoonensis]|uniref:Multicopper oxidase type 3 n=1 Tax=Gemmatirosa kalamazoonensis TaxID=861299 RepID=W0RJ73_9BACT|nr:multicopper oxidase family protein [Gemmatirosa kalamazoonensis]AHG89468.1 multicopper oxidase type 3 [Gemmatirosa kalamazoonensis]